MSAQALALPVPIDIPIPEPGSDAALIEAARRVHALGEWLGDLSHDDAALHWACEVANSLDEFIAKTPAVGATGVLVKYQRLAWWHSIGPTNDGGCDWTAWDDDLHRTITEALERLAEA